MPKSVIIVGGGPAGLTAALEVSLRGGRPLVLEKLADMGGLARTVACGGHRFDIGPHRFFTLNEEVKALFRDVGGEDIVSVPRLTRILYRNKLFSYPLTPLSCLMGVGLLPGLSILSSYVAARLRRGLSPRPILTFEDWVVDRFGRRLFVTFFKTYTEKVWGIPCARIDAEWAGQRIKSLDLGRAILSALSPSKGTVARTLASEFLYPRLGAGQLYEKMTARVEAAGGTVLRRTEATRIDREGFQVRGIAYGAADGSSATASGDFYLSSAPLTELLAQFDPRPPDEVERAAAGLAYRNHISVQLLVKGEPPFPDNWIYLHSPEVKMARVSSYRNFSPAMAAAPDIHPLTAEYFCFADEWLWQASDAELIDLARRELASMRLVAAAAVADGFVVRSPKAYPVIERGYADKVAVIKGWLDRFENFLPIGRSGMFKYNNQDHAMATGLLAARTALGLGHFDPWLVNIDGLYQEGGKA